MTKLNSRRLFFKTLFLLLIAFSVFNTGCSTLNKWMSSQAEDSAKKNRDDKISAKWGDKAKYSDSDNVLPTSNRNYKRMTRNKMEEDSQLSAQAGSMWVMEGQGAYLFAQNKMRRDGDPLNIKIEGAAQKEVETKVSVIKKLLKQLEDEEKQRKLDAMPPEETPRLADGKAAPVPAARAPAAEPKEEKDKKEDEIKIEMVSTRVVERAVDGNYRVKGTQPFMIGKREYKVIVTGLIRPEDFNDEGVGSNKLIDPQFDVVSLRRKEAL